MPFFRDTDVSLLTILLLKSLIPILVCYIPHHLWPLATRCLLRLEHLCDRSDAASTLLNLNVSIILIFKFLLILYAVILNHGAKVRRNPHISVALFA